MKQYQKATFVCFLIQQRSSQRVAVTCLKNLLKKCQLLLIFKQIFLFFPFLLPAQAMPGLAPPYLSELIVPYRPAGPLHSPNADILP